MPTQLSILICTIPARQKQFRDLVEHINKQTTGLPVAIHTLNTAAQKPTIGEKRNQLMSRATGRYVVFVDDDDWVSDDYVSSILEATEGAPDCIGFDILCTKGGKHWGLASVGFPHQEWAEYPDNELYAGKYKFIRPSYHKTPALRSIAQKCPFPHINFGEDAVYSRQLVELVKSGVQINKTLYYYRK